MATSQPEEPDAPSESIGARMKEPTRADPYDLTPDAVQEPPRTLFQALRQIGPGLILAASIVGTGELINTTSLGAKAGFACSG